MDENVLIRARYGRPVQALMLALLLGMSGFFATMAVLVSHDSLLECRVRAGCTHLERYPFGVVIRTPLVPIEKADVQWDTGGRTRALKLVLRHRDGTRTDYQGVGKNGDRAEDTANDLNDFLADAEAPARAFALREGSIPVAGFLALLAAIGLVLISHFFSKVRLARSATGITVTIERWPAKPRRHVVPLAEASLVGIKESIVNGEQFFKLQLERKTGVAIELGLAFRTAERAVAEQGVVAKALLG